MVYCLLLNTNVKTADFTLLFHYLVEIIELEKTTLLTFTIRHVISM